MIGTQVFLKCKYKHMLENGAPPVKFGVLYRLLRIKSQGFNSRIDVLGLTHVHFWYYFNFLQRVWVPLIYISTCMCYIYIHFISLIVLKC